MGRWYEEWFDRAEYELVYQHRNDDEARQLIDTIERVISPHPDDKILDVGCGRGRHSILFAERGYCVTGIDLSSKSIADARVRSADSDLSVDFRVADMRVQQCDECFDGVVNLFTAFGYFETDEEHLHALEAMVGSLRNGGWFVQDFLNASNVRNTLVPRDERVQNGLTITQRRSIDNGRISKEIVLAAEDGGRHVFNESVRLLDLSDFENLYSQVGLKIEDRLGSYSGDPFEDASPRLILFARKTRS